MRKLMTLLFAFLATIQVAFAAVDINTAGVSELDGLPGIGPSKARAIVEERTRHGPFRSVEDLKRVKGIGDKMVEKLKGHITVSGAQAGAAKADKPESAKAAGAPPKRAATGLPAPAGAGSTRVDSSAPPVPAGLKMGGESSPPAPAGQSERPGKADADDAKPVVRTGGASGKVPAPAGAKGPH